MAKGKKPAARDTAKTLSRQVGSREKGLLGLFGILSAKEADDLTDHVSKLRGYKVTTK